LKTIITGRNACVIIDETMDARGKAELLFVLTLIVKSCKGKMRALLTDTAAFERINATTVGGAIIPRLTKKGVNFDQVSGFVCDGARYRTASYRNITVPKYSRL